MADNNDIEFDAKNRDEVLGIYHILLALMIVLTSHGFMLGNNGSDGDFALNYCNDSDALDRPSDPYGDFTEFVAQESFFACEIGFIDGTVDLGWEILINQYYERIDDVMILNHENYKKFVTGVTFVFDAGNPLWHLSNFDNDATPEDSLDAHQAYNRFMQNVTGFNAKQRIDRAKAKAKREAKAAAEKEMQA